MSRSGYSDDCDQWELIKYRGQVASAIRGKRGQAFLLELIAALDAMPEKKLIAHDLEKGGAVCAIGSVGKARGIDMTELDPECPDQIAGAFGIARQLVAEIEFENDEDFTYQTPMTPEQRWQHMREWAVAQIRPVLIKEDP